jgi:hypothetical protein
MTEKRGARARARRSRDDRPHYTERINLLLTPETYDKLAERARRERRPIPDMIRWFIEEGLLVDSGEK